MRRHVSEREIFNKNGFLERKNLFNEKEVALLLAAAKSPDVTDHAFEMKDRLGKRSRLTLWFTPGDDTLGLMSRSDRIVGYVQYLLGDGEVCHFHSKVMQKEPRVGGAWEWHQDYGYWYQNGFLYPDAMLSVMIALTDANKENGCLQVLKGSHKMQRFQHLFTGDQQGADIDFVKEARKQLALAYCELQAGDVLFFHSNLLHRSAENLSENARWSIISAYNLSYNIPFKEENHSCIEPIRRVSDKDLLDKGYMPLGDVDFLEKEQELKSKRGQC